MTKPDTLPASVNARVALDDIGGAQRLMVLCDRGPFRFDLRLGRDIWVIATHDGKEIAALRVGFARDEASPEPRVRRDDAGIHTIEFASSLGAMRAKISFPTNEAAVVRSALSVISPREVAMPAVARDVFALDAEFGTVHTNQRSLRTGIVFCSAAEPGSTSLFYLQNFSSLSDYFAAVKKPPADTVGGRWPEIGYAMPSGEDCVLPAAREIVISDVFLTVLKGAPTDDAEIAGMYLDAFAQTYLALPKPTPEYHDWLARADQSLKHLTNSPECSGIYSGKRYLLPYVGDRTKPPESMVQFTVSVNMAEYDRWRNASSPVTEALRNLAPTFFDASVGSIVRWLPGVDFDADQAEDTMSHEAMDSWYIHHALFNVGRMARESGDASARTYFERSLEYIIRVARRFAYRWPIFFHTKTLDVIRAEAGPGRGGETDVGGLYALVMLHAYEMFGGDDYLEEAKHGLQSLEGLGFRLGYQLNTTGFAAEAAMRMFIITGDRKYLGLSEICMANIFDNMWLWTCDYERGKHYRSFFGMFPLHDAPYLAAYEELEAQGKSHDYLPLAGEHLRPSLRLLLAEYQKFALDRAWFYYPDALPKGVVAENHRNGTVERALSIPLEDMQDGLAESGQVGQEVYGAGLPFVYASRHYINADAADCRVFCDYPMYDAGVRKSEDGRQIVEWRADGDPRLTCELRVIPKTATAARAQVTVDIVDGADTSRIDGRLSSEGHAVFEVHGGQSLRIEWHNPDSNIISAVPLGLFAVA